MTRLFLVRRGLESYTGPFSLEEFVRRYEAMDFSLQDEVSGSFGPWIPLDNLPALKKNYPDVAKIVRDRFLGGWSGNETTSLSRSASSDRNSKKRARRKNRRAYALSALVLFLALAFLGMTVFLKQNKSLIFSGLSESQNLRKELSQIDDLNLLKEKMTPVLPEILQQMTKSRLTYKNLIGVVRVYAFQFYDGSLPGQRVLSLSGVSKALAPSVCSLSEWQKQWEIAGDFSSNFAAASADPSAYWARILFWNPHAIKWRQDPSLKLDPRSYYEGCLMMALKALSLNQTIGPGLKPELSERLETIIAIIGGRDRAVEANPFGTLGFLSCLDRAKNLEESNLCRVKKTEQKTLDTLAETYRNLAELRLMIQKTPKDQLGRAVNKFIQERDLRDTLNQVGLEAEKSLTDILSSGGISLGDAVKQVAAKYQEINENY